jgi:hypothetical protein
MHDMGSDQTETGLESMTIKPSHIAAAKLKVAMAARRGEQVEDWISKLAARKLTDAAPTRE